MTSDDEPFEEPLRIGDGLTQAERDAILRLCPDSPTGEHEDELTGINPFGGHRWFKCRHCERLA